MAIAGYEIRYRKTSGGGYTVVDVGLDVDRSYDLTGLDPLTEYGVQVRAYDAAGNYGAWSTPEQTETTGSAPSQIVAAASAGATGGGTTATTAAINTTGAKLLVLSVAFYTGAGLHSITVTDSNGNTWSPLTVALSSNYAVQLFYAENPTVGTGHTFTVNVGGTMYHAFSVAAVIDVKLTAPFDVENGAGANATSVQPGSITPTAGNELVVVGVASAGSFGTVDSGFTSATTTPFVSGDHVQSSIAVLRQGSSPSAVNPTATTDSAPICAAIASFKKV